MYLVRPQRFRVQLSRLGITCRRQHFSYLRLNKVRPHLPMRRPQPQLPPLLHPGVLHHILKSDARRVPSIVPPLWEWDSPFVPNAVIKLDIIIIDAQSHRGGGAHGVARFLASWASSRS